MDTGKGKALKWIWIYLIFPTIGGIVAVFFHEFVYTKTQAFIDEAPSSEPRFAPPGEAMDTKTEELM